MRGTEDVEAVVIEDHLLCSGVVLSLDGGDDLAGLLLCVLVDFNNKEILFVGSDVDEAAVEVVGHAESLGGLC